MSGPESMLADLLREAGGRWVIRGSRPLQPVLVTWHPKPRGYQPWPLQRTDLHELGSSRPGISTPTIPTGVEWCNSEPLWEIPRVRCGGPMSSQRRRPLKVGVFIWLFEGFMNGRTAKWTEIAAMAHKAEELGFDSIWLPDHFLIRDDPGEETVGVWECTTMLSALAAVTSRIELGTLVLCSGIRNPAVLAKMADTIDEISSGRLILGLGAGHHDPEYHAFGYPTDHRYSRFAEAVQIIHGLLRNGSIDFDGTYYRARECELRPRGPRASGPPILIGTRGLKMLRLTAQYADLWNAFLLGGRSLPQELEPAMGQLDAACKEMGRDPSTLGRTASVHWNPSDRVEVMPSWLRSRFGPPLTGRPVELAEVFREFARAGISHIQVIVWPNSVAGIEALCPVLEALDQST